MACRRLGGTREAGRVSGSAFPEILDRMRYIATANSSRVRFPSFRMSARSLGGETREGTEISLDSFRSTRFVRFEDLNSPDGSEINLGKLRLKHERDSDVSIKNSPSELVELVEESIRRGLLSGGNIPRELSLRSWSWSEGRSEA